jgi:hypothetical protein
MNNSLKRMLIYLGENCGKRCSDYNSLVSFVKKKIRCSKLINKSFVECWCNVKRMWTSGKVFVVG